MDELFKLESVWIPVLTTGNFYVIRIFDKSGTPIVGILRDGSVEYGEGLTSYSAAKEFWEAVFKAFPLK
jgi:hypothetical protein